MRISDTKLSDKILKGSFEPYSRDYGNLSRIMPSMVVQPESIEDVQNIISFARRQGLRVVSRGAGNSGYGQTLTDQIVLDTSNLTGVEHVADDVVRVGAGVKWSELQETLIPMGLSNHVLTSLPEHTVGGTLSVGGFGRTSILYGTQADQAVGLEIVTGTGELVYASPDGPNSDLFNYSLCALGQTGIIVQAYIKIGPLKPYSILFTRKHAEGTGIEELAKLIKYEERRETCIMGYSIETRTWQSIIGFDTEQKPVASDERRLIVEHYHRERYRNLAKVVRSFLESQLRSGLISSARDSRVLMGDCLVPARCAGEFFEKLKSLFVDARLTFDIHGYFLNPTCQANQLPLSPIPGGELATLFSFPCFLASAMVEEYRRLFDQAIEKCLELGGRLYLYGYYPQTASFMAAQFGAETFKNWRAVKTQYDPGSILGPQII